MKKVTMTALSLLVCGSLVFASTGNKKSKKNKSESQTTLTYAGDGVYDFKLLSDAPGKVNVKIYASDGKPIFERKITHNSSVKVPFDLSELEEGNYEFVVERNGITVENHDVFLSRMEKKDLAAFVKKLNDTEFQLKVFHDNSPVSVSVIDEDGREYFSEKIDMDNNFSQVFDLERVQNKDLTVVVSTSSTTISKSL